MNDIQSVLPEQHRQLRGNVDLAIHDVPTFAAGINYPAYLRPLGYDAKRPPMQIFMREKDAAGFQECTSFLDDLLYGIDPGKDPTAINGIEATALERHIAEVSQYEFDIA